ncbi:MAG: phage-shock protein [Firmicutes bacterium]|nr:phage-shock protein [Bacillota bacterium]
MSGKLNSLTDVLKKTLFFFETLSAPELVPYVHRQMLAEYTPGQVEERIRHCLTQHKCFSNEDRHNWTLNLEGRRENDKYYNLLLKKQKPLSLNEMTNNGSVKKKRKPVSETAGLINDGRFVQLENGYWGLTEWEVESGNYSLRHLVIKALKLHPTGLSPAQLRDVVGNWRNTKIAEIKGMLSKFPYFEEIGDGVWCYNAETRIIHDRILKRYLEALKRQGARWHSDRERWSRRSEGLKKQLEEVTAARREAAAALALRKDDINRYDQMVTQMAEKDLLLALRKKEIYRYKEHLQKLDSKANSILYQCRLWVKRARDNEAENNNFRESLQRNQQSLETLFSKLQQYKERDRESKTGLMELKEQHAERVAELQTTIVNLRQKLERNQDARGQEEEIWRDEINTLSTDLKHSMSEGERLNRVLRLAQQELAEMKNEYAALEMQLTHPLVRLVVRLVEIFSRSPRQVL